MGKEPHFISTWLLFGKEGTVKTVTNTSPKLADKVLQFRMVGYVKDHHGDLYHMWNSVTKWVHVTRDLSRLKQNMFQKCAEEYYDWK